MTQSTLASDVLGCVSTIETVDTIDTENTSLVATDIVVPVAIPPCLFEAVNTIGQGRGRGEKAIHKEKSFCWSSLGWSMNFAALELWSAVEEAVSLH